MKKILIILFAVFIFTGCNNKNEYEETMKDYATEYFNLHMSGSEFLNDPVITISDLKDGVEILGDKFDMTKLSKCKKESAVTLILNKSTNEIVDYKFNMLCEEI